MKYKWEIRKCLVVSNANWPIKDIDVVFLLSEVITFYAFDSDSDFDTVDKLFRTFGLKADIVKEEPNIFMPN